MNPVSLALLARGFTVAAAVLGLPSLAVLVLYALHTIGSWRAAASAEPRLGEHTDALLRLLQGLSLLFGGLAQAVAAITQIVLDIAALAAGAGLVLALACWFTGRGLQADANWARVSAGLLLGPAVLLVLLLALSVRGVGRVPLLVLVVVGVLGLHTLWTGGRNAGP